MIVFGSSIGASYDPHTNTWQRLPPSTLAPEASSVGWIGRRLVAWDYEGDTQDYSPSADRWSATSQNPFGFGECYPQSVATETSMFAWFCGKAGDRRPQSGQLGARLWRRHRPHGALRRHTAQAIPDRLARACRGRDRARRHRRRGQPWRPMLRLQRLARQHTGCTARSPRRLPIGRCRCASPRHCTSLLGNRPRASESATHDTATRSRSPQPGPDAQLSPGISRWMAGTWRSSTCRSISRATCRAGPFEGLERGAASRIWYLHITKHTRAPANVSVTVRFRRH